MENYYPRFYCFFSLQVTFLEESVGSPTLEILIDIDAIDNIEMHCKGGKESYKLKETSWG